jgi:CheY-like chemotaxis protein/HPt (histidine-containing phosphotransfer) domain-containing protein
MPVLIADDHATNRTILAEMLASWRMTPMLADGGQAALAAAQGAATPEETFPLILLDSVMPDLDGFAVAQRIKQDPKQRGAIILMLSSAEQPGDLERCRELDIAAFLRKPIRESQMKDAILTALGKLANEPAPAAEAPTEVRRSLHILLAEDNPVNQDFAVSLLQKHGHRVVVANDGREALAAWEKEPFDLILMDVQMPEMDGFATTRAIREKERDSGKHIPIIAATAYALSGDRERCLEAGMDAYISKPIRGAALLQVIAGLVAAHTPAPPAAPAAPAPQGMDARNVFDLDTALEYVEGDREILKNMVRIYMKQSPRLLEEIREAIAGSDGAALARSAHRLKGSMSMFGATAACAPAQALEDMGNNGDMDDVRGAHAVLERQASLLEDALARFNEDRE